MLNHRSFFLGEIVGIVLWEIDAELLVVLDYTWFSLATGESVTLSLRKKNECENDNLEQLLDFTFSMVFLMQGMGYNISPDSVMKTPMRMNPSL